MNSPANTAPESSFSPYGVASATWATLHPFYWSIRRELWENRWVYLAPLAAGCLFLFGFAISAIRMRLHAAVDKALLWSVAPSEVAPALIMGTAFIVGVFYSLDTLYGERRDRSILFWKSLPVSDATVVLSKFIVPILILPLLSFIITVATQFFMLVISSAIFAGSGVNVASLWGEVSFVRVPLIWFYHLLTVHGLWYAPIYGWLLLVSAWAPRAPFLWAFLPPFVIYGVEKIAFNTSYFLNLLQYRLTGPGGGMAPSDHQHDAAALIPHHFFTSPGLWTGLALATVFLFATVQLRRSRGPI